MNKVMKKNFCGYLLFLMVVSAIAFSVESCGNGSTGNSSSQYTETAVVESSNSNSSNQGSYEFYMQDGTVHVVVTYDLKEETAKIVFDPSNYHGVTIPGGTFYGTCEDYGRHSRTGVIRIGDFTGADDFNIRAADLIWSGTYAAFIDTDSGFLYPSTSTLKAKNPNFRIPVKKKN